MTQTKPSPPAVVACVTAGQAPESRGPVLLTSRAGGGAPGRRLASHVGQRDHRGTRGHGGEVSTGAMPTPQSRMRKQPPQEGRAGPHSAPCTGTGLSFLRAVGRPGAPGLQLSSESSGPRVPLPQAGSLTASKELLLPQTPDPAHGQGAICGSGSPAPRGSHADVTISSCTGSCACPIVTESGHVGDAAAACVHACVCVCLRVRVPQSEPLL